MIIAEYKCGCTWVGNRRECIEYCGKHGETWRFITRIGDTPENERGWDWELDKNSGTKKPMVGQAEERKA